MLRSLPYRRRCLAVWGGATAVLGLLAAGLLPHLARFVGRPGGDFEAWLVAGCELTALAGVTWGWLLVGLVVVEQVGGRRSRAVPDVARRLVLAACGLGLVGSLAAPAYAEDHRPPLAGLPLPDRPISGHVTAPAPRPASAAPRVAHPGPQTVRVRTGDSLWTLAARDLPLGASHAAVTDRWQAIHAANRAVIGSDPDLILPGQRLRLPPVPPSAT